jgi:hypothetical protein
MDLTILRELDRFRDISFKERAHTYFYKEKECISTTSLVGQYQKPFETEIIAARYAKKHNIPVIDVLKDWEEKRDSAAIKGTHVHAYAEYLFQNKVYEDPQISDIDPDLLRFVDNFYEDVRNRLILVKAEMVVGDYGLGVCGMLDKFFYNPKYNELQIYDYKTNKEIKDHSPYGNKMINGLDHLDDCEMTKFSLQLGIYKYIIEKNTNISVGNCYICWLNNDKNENYVIIPIWDLSEEVGFIMKEWENRIR